MALRNIKLNDYDLIRYCHEQSGKLGILSDITRGQLKRLWESIEPEDELSRAGVLMNHHPKVRNLWYNLLIDAIHALKVRDAREKAEIKRFDDSDVIKRTKARKKSAYGINELSEYFDAFETFEGVLYGSEPVYRDHVVHVLRVWLIGVRILVEEGIQNLEVGLRVLGPHQLSDNTEGSTATEAASGGRRKEKSNPTAHEAGVWNEELWGIWTLTALC